VSAQTRIEKPFESARVRIERSLKVPLYSIKAQAVQDGICVLELVFSRLSRVRQLTFRFDSVEMDIAVDVARDHSRITPDCETVVVISGDMLNFSHDN
jgi:hypothetical protein